MKTLIISAMMFAATSAFGYFLDTGKEHHLSGHGRWKTDAGEHGHYHVDLTILREEGGKVSLIESLRTDNEQMQYTYQLAKTDHGFFDVLVDGNKVGGGYCFHIAHHGAKVCHLQSTVNDVSTESTLHFELNKVKVHRMGSFPHAGGTIAWRDHLHVKHVQEN